MIFWGGDWLAFMKTQLQKVAFSLTFHYLKEENVKCRPDHYAPIKIVLVIRKSVEKKLS